MKNKFTLTLLALLLIGGCSSVQEEEREEPEVILYKQSQDRINAKNFIDKFLVITLSKTLNIEDCNSSFC